ncbi:BatD family protein [Dyella silvae]|uniref:BatD family protein n=1 Tax=Dyella silvae TaxID=2994424 RepID=UPI002263BA45|nr:BatD family protein [Dyella silvae]
MNLRRLMILCCFMLCLWPLATLAADVQATLDRTRVELGETVTLNLRAEGGGMAQTPDLRPLSQDFAVLGSSSNTSLSIINGKRSAQVTVGVALRPLHAGTLQIPALSFAGGTTAPLQLEVVSPNPADAAAGRKDVFLEATIDPASGYVGQQRVYTVRLFFAANLSSGALEDPQLAGVEVRRLGDEINYQAERGGRRYNVIERRYAVTPQREGQLVIPPVAFQGEMVNLTDPDAFFGNGTPMSASSPPVSIDVRPAPAQAAKSAWLPARDLALHLDGGPAQGELRVGVPVNLVMSLQATGLPYEALPALSLPALDGATVYPDKPVEGTRIEGSWLVGRRQQGFAIVPSRAGTLTIPETTLTWWNVVTDHLEVARVPAQTFTVLPAIGASNAAPATAMPAVPAHATPIASAPVVTGGVSWRWVAIGSLCLWVVSLVVWLGWRWRQSRGVTAAPSAEVRPAVSRLRAAFLTAARGTDVSGQANALLSWARAEQPQLQNLSELAAALIPGPQADAIAALQRKHYAGADEPALGDRLAAAFRDGFAWQQGAAQSNPSPLPPLYPFNLHQ